MRALIAGGGIAGSAAALFLKRAGVEPVVLEAYPRRVPAGGALGLAPNGMSVLGQLGLAEAALAAGAPIDRFVFTSPAGKRWGEMAWGPAGRYRWPSVSLSRATVADLLLDALDGEGIAVAYGKRLEGLDQDAAGVTARFADGSTERGDILIGADGLRSRVREAILPDAPKPAFTGLVGSGGFLPRSAMDRILGPDCQRDMTLAFGDGVFVGYAYGDRREETGAYWWYALPRDQPLDERERAALSHNAIQTVLAAGGWSETVRAILAATTVMAPTFDLFDVASLPRWRWGRVVLIGDAAHAVSPHSGQGVSMALEDALVLARSLRDHGLQHEAAFAAYEAERKPRAERVVAMGRRSGDQKRQGGLGQAIQRVLAPLFLRLAPPPRWLFGYEAHW